MFLSPYVSIGYVSNIISVFVIEFYDGIEIVVVYLFLYTRSVT